MFIKMSLIFLVLNIWILWIMYFNYLLVDFIVKYSYKTVCNCTTIYIMISIANNLEYLIQWVKIIKAKHILVLSILNFYIFQTVKLSLIIFLGSFFGISFFPIYLIITVVSFYSSKRRWWNYNFLFPIIVKREKYP